MTSLMAITCRRREFDVLGIISSYLGVKLDEMGTKITFS